MQPAGEPRIFRIGCAQRYLDVFVAEPWKNGAAWPAGALQLLREIAPVMHAMHQDRLDTISSGQVGLQMCAR